MPNALAHVFVNNMADTDISDYEFDADNLLLMPIIIPQFDKWCREIFKYNKLSPF